MEFAIAQHPTYDRLICSGFITEETVQRHVSAIVVLVDRYILLPPYILIDSSHLVTSWCRIR